MFKKFLFSFALLAHVSLFAETSQGETLERQRWEHIKKHKWEDLENLIAPYFQTSFFDGARNKEQFVNLSKSVDISDYTLSNFIVTEGQNIIIVTYDASLSETIGGKRLSSKANRLSVWQNDNGKWQIIAHAILIPVPSSPTPPASASSTSNE